MRSSDLVRASLHSNNRRVSSPNIVSNTDYFLHEKSIASPTEATVLPSAYPSEELWLPWFPRHLSFVAKPLFLVLWLAYTIGAFVYDFSEANVILGINIFMIIVMTFKFIIAYFGTQISLFCASIQNFAQPFWEKKIIRATFYILLFAAWLSIVLSIVIDDTQRLVSAAGLLFIVLFAWALSWKPKHVNWRPVIWGFCLQFIFALFILRTNAGVKAFNWLGKISEGLLKFTDDGSSFVFSYLVTGTDNLLGVFAFSVLPTIIFFSSLVSILYYWGILQSIIRVIGFCMSSTLGTSASESLNAAGNIFVGQTEAPLLIKPFLKRMTRSEIHAVMTGGFATIAGGVLAIYISMGIDPTHLLASSVMGAPAALAISKIIYPETEESESKDGQIPPMDEGNETNVIEAAANGASIAVGLVANIVGMLISFLSILALLDYLLGYFGGRIGFSELSFEYICGYVFYPFAFIMGVDPADCRIVGKLIGIKVFTNEFVAYKRLIDDYSAVLSDRSRTIVTFALCGFANVGSIGIQLGALVPLAPNRRSDLASLVLSAMIAGNLACFMNACIAGLLAEGSL